MSTKMECHLCGCEVTKATAGAIVHTSPPRAWCVPCWDFAPEAVEQYRVAQAVEILDRRDNRA